MALCPGALGRPMALKEPLDYKEHVERSSNQNYSRFFVI